MDKKGTTVKQINWNGGVTWIKQYSRLVKQNVDLKDQKEKREKLITQINGKFNDVSSPDQNKYKNITVEPLFKNYTNTIPLFIDRGLRSSIYS
jgi:hypothetical protein